MNKLAEGRHRVARQRAQRRVVGRHLAPAQHVGPSASTIFATASQAVAASAGRLRQEGDAGGGTLGGQFEIDHRAQERIGDLQHDAGPSPLCVRRPRPAVLEVQQGGDRLVDDVPATPAVDVDDHRDTTGIVFECGLQPDTSGHSHLALHKLYARRFSGIAAAPSGVPRASVNGSPAGQQVVKRYAKHRLTCQLSPPKSIIPAPAPEKFFVVNALGCGNRCRRMVLVPQTAADQVPRAETAVNVNCVIVCWITTIRTVQVRSCHIGARHRPRSGGVLVDPAFCANSFRILRSVR